MLRKTSTTALLEKIEKLVVAVNDTGSNAESIIDVMAVVQKIVAKYKTFKISIQQTLCWFETK